MSLRTLERLKENGMLAMPDECVGCRDEFKFGQWHVIHGYAHCANCGVVYEIKTEDEPTPLHTEELNEAIRSFYLEFETPVHRAVRFNSYLEKHYPELVE